MKKSFDPGVRTYRLRPNGLREPAAKFECLRAGLGSGEKREVGRV